MKKLMNRIKSAMLVVASGILLITCLSRCKQDHLTINTSGTVNIYSYLQQNNQFSMFKQIVDKAGYASFLNTYGTYTCFVPNNDGVTAYLKANNIASVDNIDAATAKNMVGIALIADTLGTQVFIDGKLRTPTTLGQYITTGAVNTVVNGVSVTKTVINKQANLVQGNIKVGNGLIHVIDNVLTPAPYTLYQTIAHDPRYSIFKQALDATGFSDTLDIAVADNPNPSRKYMTLIAETDSTFLNSDPQHPIPDFAALKARYSTKGDPKNHADSLWLFVAYHIWPELSYVSDIALLDSHTTLAPLEITTSTFQAPNVLLNDDTFNGKHEIGTVVDRSKSDISASNGVVNTVFTHYSIKVRFPTAVYYDVAAQPEIIKVPGLFRHPGAINTSLTSTPSSTSLAAFADGKLANIVSTPALSSSNTLAYFFYINDTNPSSHWFYWGDALMLGGRFRDKAMNSVFFTTPLIVRGQYKIWADYLRQTNGHAQVVPAYFDGVALPNILNNGDALNYSENERAAEARGYKWYSDAPIGDTTNNGAKNTNPYGGYIGRLLGIVNIATTDHHVVRFDSTLDATNAAYFPLDVIEFRPVTMDQLHPRLGHDGTLIP